MYLNISNHSKYMTNKSVLLNKLLRIELFNLKNICPLVYKRNTESSFTPFDKYSLEPDNTFVNIKKHHTKFTHMTTSIPIHLSHVYFINGYSKHISLQEHVSKKYHVD